MSDASRCSFCLNLPVAVNPRAGRPGKCPLCKGDIVVAPSGTTCRLTAPGEVLPSGGGTRRLALAGLGAAACAAGVLLVLTLLAARDSGSRPETQPQLAQVARPADASPRTSPWDGEAQPVQEQPAPAQPLVEVLPAPRAEVVPEASAAAVAVPEQIAPPAKAELPRPAPAATPPSPSTSVLAMVSRFHAKHASEEDYSLLLQRVPEVSLADGDTPPKTASKDKVEIAKRARAIQDQAEAIREQTAKGPDAFVAALVEKRPDLAGLPFLKGKDCLLDKDGAKTWAISSAGLRMALDAVRVARPSPRYPPAGSFAPQPDVVAFWSRVHPTLLKGQAAVPALEQMLQVEAPALRSSIVEHLAGKREDPGSGAALARRAVFDLDRDVRARAVKALEVRPIAEYRQVLLDALRHPWAPVAEHAAEALVELKFASAVPDLVRLLDEPDPAAPFVAKVGGKDVPVRREVVRVNHFRNCLLCHAPSAASETGRVVRRGREFPEGPIPVPGEPIPSRASLYYAERSGATFVRADVTYLRQDFSVMLPVPNAKPWPALQRYDFLVRTRPLTTVEQAEWDARKRTPEGQVSEHMQAVLFALQSLTGLNIGPSAREWERALRDPAPPPAHDASVRGVGWRRQCGR